MRKKSFLEKKSVLANKEGIRKLDKIRPNLIDNEIKQEGMSRKNVELHSKSRS